MFPRDEQTMNLSSSLKTNRWQIAAFALLLVGCAARDPQAGLKATLVNKKLGTNDYWMQQPPVAHASADDFQRLWRAARRVAMDHGFGIDRVGLREGVMTSFPLTSK